MVLHVYTGHVTNRLKYVLDLVLIQMLGVEDYQLFTDQSSYRKSPLPKINYSRERIDTQEFFIPSSGLLAETLLIQKQYIELKQENDLPYIFPQSVSNANLPFDLFAMIFYLVSRYEEYLDFTGDFHNRFPAKASIAYQNGFLDRPLINEWIIRLGQLLRQQFPGLKVKSSNYRFCPTYDIDMAWAYEQKGLFRSTGAFVKDLLNFRFSKLSERILVQLGQKTDPFFIFEYLDRLNRQENLDPIYFFLVGDYGKFDKNISIKNKVFQELIAKTSNHYRIGIHPSYKSSQTPGLINKEVARLSTLIKKPILFSRQHFLRLLFPQSYQNLLAAGIQEDFTMGYASIPGYRASIATPFYWYDLHTEQSTSLLIHPFQLMDVTLKKYLKSSPEEAIEIIRPLIASTRQVGGHFTTIWHNSSFAASEGWQSWKQVYERLIQLAR